MYNNDYEYQKRLPISGNVDIKEIIQNGGYYDVNNNWNSIVEVNGYPNMVFRGRVEVFLFRNDRVYVDISTNRYRLPGGSFDIRRNNYSQVFNELKEETKILSKNIYYTGLSYVNVFDNYIKPTKSKMSWHGTYNEVYLAEFDKVYKGFIKGSLYDRNMHDHGSFHPISQVLPILKKEHITALKMAKII